MKRRIYLLLSVFVLVSMLLGACATAAPTEAPVVEEAPVETEAPPEPAETEEPVEAEEPEPTEEPEPAMATEEDVAAAFSAMLAGMEKYNTTKMDAVMEGMAEDTPPFLLDVRELKELEEKGHIEGAVHIPLRELGKNLEKLPSTDTPIVAYCGSGWRATIAMTALSTLGWENVTALKNTFDEWVEAGNPVVAGPAEEAMALNAAEVDAGLAAAMDEMLSNLPEGWGVITADDLNLALGEKPDMVVIDVRRQEEVDESGSIDTGEVEQIHIPLEAFIDSSDQWPADKDAEIVIYCGSGHRSTIAMSILYANGYSNVKSLKGGFSGWKDAGYATVDGEVDVVAKLDEAYANVLANMEGYNTIKMEALNEELATDTPPFLLDVRTAAEVEEKGYIEGAVLIPLAEIGKNLDKLPGFDTPVVAYCGSGWRATIAMTALSALGWNDVRALKSTFQEYVDAGYAVAEGLPEDPMLLDAAQPDTDLVAVMDQMFSSIPEGFGVITAEDLNLLLGESPDMKLIDVRRLEELEENGVIDSGEVEQTHIALEDFIAEKGMWPAELDAQTAVYCGSGHRSTMAMTILWSYLYSDLKSLKGGFGSYKEAGFPVAEFVAQ